MMEMSALGAGVLETRSVELAKNYDIPLYLGRTLSNEKGTWIMSRTDLLEKKAVTGVALDKHMMHVTISYPYLIIVFNAIVHSIRRRFSKCGYDIPNS